MYYKIIAKTFVRVPPSNFGKDVRGTILSLLNEQFTNYVSERLGIVIGVLEVLETGEGVIIPGDGAAYHDTRFVLLTFKPEVQEMVLGTVSEITDFGAFMDLGAIEGMIHVSQAMDDFVSFSKSNVLTGKETKKVLKVGDKCRARIIAVSFKDLANPKVGLTMRQPLLGAMNWIDEELKASSKVVEEKEKPKK